MVDVVGPGMCNVDGVKIGPQEGSVMGVDMGHPNVTSGELVALMDPLVWVKLAQCDKFVTLD